MKCSLKGYSQAWLTVGFPGMAGQKNAWPKKRAGARRLRPRGHSSVLAWLSLVGLLPSRAQLRFTRQIHHNSHSTNGYRPNPITGSAEPYCPVDLKTKHPLTINNN